MFGALSQVVGQHYIEVTLKFLVVSQGLAFTSRDHGASQVRNRTQHDRVVLGSPNAWPALRPFLDRLLPRAVAGAPVRHR